MSDLELCYTCERYGECDVYSRLFSLGHDLLYTCADYRPVNDPIEKQTKIEEVSEQFQEWNGMLVKCEKNILAQQSVRAFELSCDGCKFVGTYDTDFPCSRCIRREKDYYERER